MSNVTVIGSKVTVDFPRQGILNVPAKVDTGADRSALWASDITEADGVLSFTLFDRQSPFYTGETITTTDFSIASIKNSFGQAEYRYKVKLPVVLSGRKLRITFTLANRANNSQPILIGRRTLHGKFVVDVAVPEEPAVRRMLLVSQLISKNVENFVAGFEAAATNLETTYITYDDLLFTFTAAGPKITLATTGEDVANFDILYCKTSVERDITAALARYCQRRGVRVFDPAIAYFPTTSKLYEYMLLAEDSALRIPDSVFMLPSRLGASYDVFVETLGLPFVLKGIHASKGDHNDIITNAASFDKCVQAAHRENVYLIGQAFVPNIGDYRVLVLGQRIALIINRLRDPKSVSHLNNTSKGSDAALVSPSDFPSEVQIACLQAAKIINRDIVGVDIVQNSQTGEWLCFETNDGPQLATGAFVKEKQQAFAEFIETELGK